LQDSAGTDSRVTTSPTHQKLPNFTLNSHYSQDRVIIGL